MDKLLALMVVLFLQCKHLPKHQVVYLKSIQFLFVKDILTKLLKKSPFHSWVCPAVNPRIAMFCKFRAEGTQVWLCSTF